MKTFGELLSLYIKNAGITDSELARAIGVSRQTIFRWREGLTTRPNSREDVIAIAEKLRLSPEEKNNLLLSAGFRPDEGQALSESLVPPATQPKKESAQDSENIEQPETTGQPMIKPKRHIKLTPRSLLLVAIVLVIISGAWIIGQNWSTWFQDTSPPGSPTATPPTDNSSSNIIPAAPGELLICIAPLSLPQTTTTTDQLVEFIERESRNNRITNVRVDLLPEPIADANKASEVIKDTQAKLIIYGETVNGEAVMYLASGTAQSPLSIKFDENEMATDNIKALSLVILGSLYLSQADEDLALLFLSGARNVIADAEITNASLKTAVEQLFEKIQ